VSGRCHVADPGPMRDSVVSRYTRLRGYLAAGYQLLSGDDLILYRTVDGLAVTSLPGPISVQVGTDLDYACRPAAAPVG
jgi:hypothetical protein